MVAGSVAVVVVAATATSVVVDPSGFVMTVVVSPLALVDVCTTFPLSVTC